MADAEGSNPAALLLAGAAAFFFVAWAILKQRKRPPVSGSVSYVADRSRSSPANWEYSPRAVSSPKDGQKAGKRSNMKGKPSGDFRGQAPDKRGDEKSYKKLRERRGKEDERIKRRERRAERVVPDGVLGTDYSACDVAAKMSTDMWRALNGGVFGGRTPSLDEEKQLRKYYTITASGNEAGPGAVRGVEYAYAYDKFPLRTDEMCCVLLRAHAEHPAAMAAALGGSARVLSLGGGPGNDAIGALLARAIAQLPCDGFSATVYDYAPTWGPLVEQVNAGLRCDEVKALLPAVTEAAVDFSMCDMQRPADDDVNSNLVAAVPSADVILASYALSESSALSCSLFGELLERVRPGAVVAVIDVYKQVVLDACNIAETTGFTTHVVPNSSDTPFFSAYFIKQ